MCLPSLAQKKARPAKESGDASALKQKAYGYFSKGELLFDSGDFTKAAEAFLLAYETIPHPATLLNVAICFEKSDRPADAIEMYEKYLATSDPKDTEGRTGAERRIKALSNLSGHLDISCGLPACEVSVDGKNRGVPPIRLKMDAGAHTVKALSNGAEVLSMEAVVRPGKSTRVDLKALPVERGTTEKPPSILPPVTTESGEEAPDTTLPAGVETEEKRHLRAPFWIASGLTLASCAVAIVFSVKLQNDIDEFEKVKDEDSDKAAKWKEQGKEDMLAANILWGVTGAAALAAITLAIVDLVPKKKNKDTPSAEPQVNATLGPGTGLGLGLSVSF
jgi:hypothetical protein